jgi:hypothetical protein
MASIAVDEVSHAALSGRIASWLATRLCGAERQQIAHARQDAIRELRRCVDHDPNESLVAELGVPSRTLALHLLDALEKTLWSAARFQQLDA